MATRKKLAQVKCIRNEVAFAPNGEFVAFDDNGVCVVAIATGQTICRIPAKGAPMAITPDSKAVVAFDKDHVLALWDAATGKQIRRFSGHLGQGSRLAGLSPDGQRLALITGHWQQKAGSASGMWPPERKSVPTPATRTWSVTWPLLRTANSWPRLARTGPFASGMRPPARSGIGSPAIRRSVCGRVRSGWQEAGFHQFRRHDAGLGRRHRPAAREAGASAWQGGETEQQWFCRFFC